ATVAALTIFVPIADAAAHEFASQTGADFALFIGDTLAASTLPLSALSAENRTLFAQPTAVQEHEITHNHYFTLSGILPAIPNTHRVRYVLLSSYEESLRELQSAQRALWILSIVGILVSAGLVWICVGRATEPLQKLRDAAIAVGRG